MIKGIIIEGSDCSGKTTLIEALKGRLSHLGWQTINVGHEQTNQFDRYMSLYINSDKVIFDRGHFSEIVYGHLWRGGHGMSHRECSLLDQYVFSNFLVVFAHAPEEILKARYQARSYDQIIKGDELAVVQSRLARLLTHPSVLKYDSTSLVARDGMVNSILLLLNINDASLGSVDEF